MLSRRALIGAIGYGVGLSGAAALAAEPPRPLTKAEAHYQDQPKDIRRCATCTLFIAPTGCKAVVGEVSRDGWCDLYDFVD